MSGRRTVLQHRLQAVLFSMKVEIAGVSTVTVFKKLIFIRQVLKWESSRMI